MRRERRILKFIRVTNLILFCLTTLYGVIMTPMHFALGILAGGLIVTVNFSLMYKSIEHALTPPHFAELGPPLVKYIIRFLASVMIIFLLISEKYVHPLGLLVGLSVIVVSFLSAAFYEARRLYKNERG